MRDFEIVTFYVNEDEDARAETDILGGIEQIRLLYRSAQRSNPGTSLTIITSPKTNLSALEFPFLRIDSVQNAADMMLERTRTQCDYVRSALSQSRPMAFLDTDMLITQDISILFKRDFDICLTWRENPEMPFNGGIIMLNALRPAAGLAFFERFLASYQGKFMHKAKWFGDQLALADVIGLAFENISQKLIHTEQGIRYSFLPCETHNYTPRAADLWTGNVSEKKAILHFKGSTKRLMEPFWNLHFAAAEKPYPFLFPRIVATQARLFLKRRVSKLFRSTQQVKATEKDLQ